MALRYAPKLVDTVDGVRYFDVFYAGTWDIYEYGVDENRLRSSYGIDPDSGELIDQ